MRVGLCSSGTRLLRCGNRLQPCGAVDLACGSIGRHFECPALDNVLPDQVENVYAGHRWSFEAWRGRVITTADREPFPGTGYTGTYTVNRTYTDRWFGVFGLAIQWGRAPTDAEVIAQAGLGDWDVIAELGEPRGVGGAIGRFYLAFTQDTGTGDLAGLLQALDLLPSSNQLGVQWTAPTGPCERLEFPEPQLGRTRYVGGWLEGDALAASVKQGFGSYVNDDTGQASFAYPGLADRALIVEDATEQALTVQRVGDPVELPGDWEGPPDGLVCPEAPPAPAADGNEQAIAGMMGRDPVAREGCCG